MGRLGGECLWEVWLAGGGDPRDLAMRTVVMLVRTMPAADKKVAKLQPKWVYPKPESQEAPSMAWDASQSWATLRMPCGDGSGNSSPGEGVRVDLCLDFLQACHQAEGWGVTPGGRV